MKERVCNNRRNGFTLVEVIVALVILAILAAILIPAMVGWIEKAREGEAISEARHCLTAAEGLAVELYAAGQRYDLATHEAATLALAEAPAGADIRQLTFDAYATPVQMVFLASNGLTVTYANGAFTVSQTGGVDFSNSGALGQIYPVMQGTVGDPRNQYYYSGTAGAAQLDAALKEAGIDLDASAANWSIRYSSSYPKLYWTDDDLSTHKAGDVIPVMAYTLSTGRYTVWNVRLVQQGGALALGSEANMLTKVEGDAQTYTQMITDYQNAVKP